ncbi:MAG TPA: hypothetical protein VGU22_20210 [Methylomirabilota bacterium]|jgi:hypothetical protein|nr:hypothetical protein [Methylomirabilota bacterium]
MTGWLRPTRRTWLALALLLAVVTAGAAALFAAGVDTPVWLLFLFAVERPFTLWHAVGVPVGRRGDFWGYPFPSALGWTLIVATDLAVVYLAASAIAALWARAAGAAARRRRRGTME